MSKKRNLVNKVLHFVFVLFFVVVIIALAVLALSNWAYEKLSVIFGNVNQLKFLLSLTLTSLFPISAIAYQLYQRDTQRRKLTRGFWLGIAQK